MEHKVDEVIRALEKAPRPTKPHEWMRLPLVGEIPTEAYKQGETVTNQEFYYITVKSQRFSGGLRNWLEWVIDIK